MVVIVIRYVDLWFLFLAATVIAITLFVYDNALAGVFWWAVMAMLVQDEAFVRNANREAEQKESN